MGGRWDGRRGGRGGGQPLYAVALYTAGENAAFAWWPILLNASAFEATNVFGGDSLHKLELGWHPRDLIADGNNVSKVLEEAKPRWVPW